MPVIITGPTSSGKTRLGIAVAQLRNGEIVSADARQIYGRMNIGTAKPTHAELSAVPHHLIDELEPDRSFSAGEFARVAEARIADILKRRRTPIVVGGSTLYIDTLVRGIADIPDVDPAIREQMSHRLATEGAAELYAELKSVDPDSAATMDATKSQRIVRALEVYHGTGTPLSHFHRSRSKPAFSYRGLILDPPRDVLYHRINRRVDDMLDVGLIDEVRGLLDSGVDPSVNALQTIGYREVVRHLQGDLSFEEMRTAIKRNTRRYAKRQVTWLKRYTEFARLVEYTDVSAALSLLDLDAPNLAV